MRISLVGFMGTGKSSTGKLLARRLNYKYMDTDLLIERKEGRSINDIFAQDGEAYFRVLEEEVLAEVIKYEDDLVFATGGGIVISALNRELLHSYTIPVLLTASSDKIYERISGIDRPLLNLPDYKERIDQLLAKRAVYYNEFTNRIDTDNRSQVEVVEEILKILGVDGDAGIKG
jgi:shikimate kinase